MFVRSMFCFLDDGFCFHFEVCGSCICGLSQLFGSRFSGGFDRFGDLFGDFLEAVGNGGRFVSVEECFGAHRVGLGGSLEENGVFGRKIDDDRIGRNRRSGFIWRGR